MTTDEKREMEKLRHEAAMLRIEVEELKAAKAPSLNIKGLGGGSALPFGTTTPPAQPFILGDDSSPYTVTWWVSDAAVGYGGRN